MKTILKLDSVLPLKYLGGLLPLSGQCQVSYYTMYYGLLESTLFYNLEKCHINVIRSDYQDSVFGGLFVIRVILTEKFRHLWSFGGTRWLFFWFDALKKISQEPTFFFISTLNLEHNLFRYNLRHI